MIVLKQKLVMTPKLTLTRSLADSLTIILKEIMKTKINSLQRLSPAKIKSGEISMQARLP